jgi:hypothetical protein
VFPEGDGTSERALSVEGLPSLPPFRLPPSSPAACGLAAFSSRDSTQAAPAPDQGSPDHDSSNDHHDRHRPHSNPSATTAPTSSTPPSSTTLFTPSRPSHPPPAGPVRWALFSHLPVCSISSGLLLGVLLAALAAALYHPASVRLHSLLTFAPLSDHTSASPDSPAEVVRQVEERRMALNNTGGATSIARVYADVNANMPRSYWDYDSVNISWGVLENYEVVRKIGMYSHCLSAPSI